LVFILHNICDARSHEHQIYLVLILIVI
jgi:hypothetical protein